MGFLKLGSGGGLAIALIIDIIAVATPGWIYVDHGDGNDYVQGLWQNMTDNTTTDVNRGDAEKVCAAFTIMGDVIMVCAMAAVCIGGKDGKEVIAKVGGVLAFVSAIFIMVGVAVYTGLYIDFVNQEGVSWGYSFALAWSAFCISILAAPISFIDK